MDCAKTLFLANGFEGTTIDQIAEAADVAKVTFYYYFKSKEDLALEIRRQCHEEALSYVENLRANEIAPEQMIGLLINDIVDWTEKNWRLLDVFCVQRFSPLVSNAEHPEARLEPLAFCLDFIIQRGQQSGRFRQDIDRTSVSQLLDLSILLQQNKWIRSGRPAGNLKQRLENCFDVALNGLLAKR